MSNNLLASSVVPRRGRTLAPVARTLLGFALTAASALGIAAPNLQNPVLFVTQFPISADFATIGSVFANHRASMNTTGRGGDLYIRYPNGTLRNLTQEAGYGNSGLQGANAIAVRDPAVHWNGTRAVFSMVIGAPTQYQWTEYYWQLYEVTGFGQGQTVTITKVANQPANYNNVQPTYASNGDIIFVSDRPRNGARHLYPQHDEYESTATPTGLWKLVPSSGKLSLMQHSPSGSFTPIVDSYGRVIFTRWDHLQRDQQAEGSGATTFNWASEAIDAQKLPTSVEVFPEPRTDTALVFGHRLNNFLPWMINQDGTAEETINHIGRHELFSYFNRSLRNDPSLVDFTPGGRTNPNSIENWLQIVEDPTTPGRYWGIDAPEFYTHASGQIVRMDAPPSRNPDSIMVSYMTPRNTRNTYTGTPPPDFTGHYRNPLPLADGQILAGHTSEARPAGNDGTRANPQPRYKFRLRTLQMSGGVLVPALGGELSSGISKNISYWDPDVLVTYSGPLWELSPVEVRARAVPPANGATLEAPEIEAFAQSSVDLAAFRQFMIDRGIALLVTRNATIRDRADRQQPFNLRVPGGVQATGTGGPIHDIAWMQFFQGDQIRGIGGIASPAAGRRVLAQPLHDPAALQFMPPVTGAPAGSAKIAADGSVAMFVPAQRAVTWQSTSGNGTAVVRERYWISAQPGEIRACDGCHGVNTASQTGGGAAQNPPQAMRELLDWWKLNYDPLFRSGFD